MRARAVDNKLHLEWFRVRVHYAICMYMNEVNIQTKVYTIFACHGLADYTHTSKTIPLASLSVSLCARCQVGVSLVSEPTTVRLLSSFSQEEFPSPRSESD